MLGSVPERAIRNREENNLVSIPHLGSGHGIRSGVVPFVERNPGVARLVKTGNFNSGRRVASTLSLNLKLVYILSVTKARF